MTPFTNHSVSVACVQFRYAEARFNIWFAAGSLRIWYVPVEGTMMIDPDMARNFELVLEFQEAVRACTMCPISGFKVHSLSLLFFRVFCLYPILFCSLQYIYKDMYHSYPSVCPLKSSGTTGNLIFYLISLMWSCERVRLPIWFQQLVGNIMHKKSSRSLFGYATSFSKCAYHDIHYWQCA